MGFQSNILVGQVVWQKHIPVNALWCRGHSDHMASEDLTSDFLHFEGCANHLDQLLDIPTPSMVVSSSTSEVYSTGRPTIS